MSAVFLKLCTKSITLILITLAINKTSFYKVKEEKVALMEWNVDRKLSWNDFQGIPDSSDYKAVAITKIKATPESYSNDSIVYNIRNFFNRQESWVKIDSSSQALLAHEQLHFDISELMARQTRKAYSLIDLKGLKGDYTKISNYFNYYTIYVADSIQKKYDTETNHGIDLEKQKFWEAYIRTELANYHAYSSSIVTIK